MDWILITVGAIMGFLIAVLSRLPPKTAVRTKTPTPPTPDYRRLLDHCIREQYLNRPRHPRAVGGYPFSTRYGLRRAINSRIRQPSAFTDRSYRSFFRRQRTRAVNRNVKSLVENWRRSIVGLLKLAENNLKTAERHCLMKDYRGAVEAAFTSVENISRALVHCYGEKPNPGPGQEETLRLLSHRFPENERAEFTRAIGRVARITHRKTCLQNRGQCASYTVQYISTYNGRIRSPDKTEAEEVVRSASTVVSLFKRIIAVHFVAEIPGLREACTKCRSLNVAVTSLTPRKVGYQCNNCRCKWTEPRIDQDEERQL